MYVYLFVSNTIECTYVYIEYYLTNIQLSGMVFAKATLNHVYEKTQSRSLKIFFATILGFLNRIPQTLYQEVNETDASSNRTLDEGNASTRTSSR